MHGLFRLSIRQTIDGTAMAVFLYLCFRHDNKRDRAWPSVARISRDLNMSRGRVSEALKRLQDHRLIRVRSGRFGGSRKSNSYSLPWLESCRVNRDPDAQIEWPPHSSGSPEQNCTGRAEQGGTSVRVAPNSASNDSTGRATHTVRAEQPSQYGPARTKNNKTIKQGEAPAALDGAGARKHAERIYGPRERLGPADQVMFDAEVERLTEARI